MTNSFVLAKPNNNDSLFMNYVNKILFYIFLVNVVFLPNDTFNLKIVSLLLLLLINIPLFLNAKYKNELIIIRFGLILTSVTVLWSILLTGDLTNINMGYPGFILLLYFVIKKYNIDFQNNFILIIEIFATFIAVMAILDIFKIVDMYDNPLLMWFADSSNAMIGKGDALPIRVMIFMKTSPLFFVALFSCLQNKKWISSLLFSFVIILSGTRANIIMLVVSIVFYVCFLFPSKSYRPIFWIICLIIAVVILIDGRVVNFFVDMFTRKISSDAVRDGHLKGIFETWNNAPHKIIFGSGFSSKFFSYGTTEWTANIELSYWNLLRQVGLLLFIPMMLMYLYPIVILLKARKKIATCFAYFIYLVIAYTNPFLYSSTGVTLMLYMYVMCFENKNMERMKNERYNSCRRVWNKAVPAYQSNQ